MNFLKFGWLVCRSRFVIILVCWCLMVCCYSMFMILLLNVCSGLFIDSIWCCMKLCCLCLNRKVFIFMWVICGMMSSLNGCDIIFLMSCCLCWCWLVLIWCICFCVCWIRVWILLLSLKVVMCLVVRLWWVLCRCCVCCCVWCVCCMCCWVLSMVLCCWVCLCSVLLVNCFCNLLWRVVISFVLCVIVSCLLMKMKLLICVLCCRVSCLCVILVMWYVLKYWWICCCILCDVCLRKVNLVIRIVIVWLGLWILCVWCRFLILLIDLIWSLCCLLCWFLW